MTGGKEIFLDFDACPESSVKYALNAGVTYLFANRAASTLTSWIKSEIIGESERKPTDVKADEVKAWRETNKEQVESWQSDIVNQTLADFNAGTIGVREPAAPRDEVDPLSAEMHRLAKEGVIRIMDRNEHKFPTRSKNPTTGKMEPEKFVTADGAFTGPELIARYVRNYSDSPQPAINGGKSLREVATAVLKLRHRGADESAGADLSAL